jgi:hypothetical protein
MLTGDAAVDTFHYPELKIALTFRTAKMTERTRKKRWPGAWKVAGITVALLAVLVGLGVVLVSRYSQTETTDAASAARAFQATRTRFAGQVPLLELRGIQPPVFHREGTSARVTALHALVYDPRDKSLRRWTVPIAAIRVITLGGYVRLIDFGMPGDNRARLTLEDLEQRGPGLVVDASGEAVAPIAAGAALVGSSAAGAQLLMWTE